MAEFFQPVDALKGSINLPGDKSISHRSVILGAMACGKTIIDGFLDGDDCMNSLECVQSLGIGVNVSQAFKGLKLEVEGMGLDGLREPVDVINTGNSGTLIRLIAGVLAGQNFYSVLTGDKSIRQRPMDRIVLPLKKMGAVIYGRTEATFAPLTIVGQDLQAISYKMPVASGQVKSCILLAGLQAEGITTVVEPIPSRDHTERMLEAFGARIETGSFNGNGSRKITVKKSRLQGQFVKIPGDISSAAYFMVAALLTPNSEIVMKNVGLNPLRTGIIDVLKDMGAQIEVCIKGTWCNEPVGDIIVRTSSLTGTEISGDIIPRIIDEIPIIALAASCASGKTEVSDAKELRIKESDRINSVVSQLTSIGANIQEKPDGFIIHGLGCKIKGGRFNAYGDHRMALTGAVAGMISEEGANISDYACAKVSYPDFIRDINTLV